jgi:NTP pyrophosphatase (non-canonical NTP hydrolase)
MQDLINQTKQIATRFPTHYTKQNRFLDAVEEMGEIAQAVLITENIKTTKDPAKQRDVNDIADGICDLIYNLFLLADDYHIDLPKAYQQMLAELNNRLDTGEFNNSIKSSD